MPLLFKKDLQNAQLAVWQKHETPEQLLSMLTLSNVEKAVYEQFTNERRQSEWLTSRILLNRILGRPVTIAYDVNNKPFLPDNELFISISHSKNMVAVVVSKSNVGMDIEQIAARATKVRHKFLTGNELNWCETDVDHTLVWTVKEASYKLIGNGLEHTEVEILEKTSFTESAMFKVRIDKCKSHIKICHTQLISDNILSYIVE